MLLLIIKIPTFEKKSYKVKFAVDYSRKLSVESNS